ncbi:MAG TPA: protein kinase [Polyangiaceae bacterium]|nr:protein kinase [Polyangiaceae bacterium]
MSERPDRRVGEVVGGKYRISRFLAAGGMGSVYEAQHTLVKRRFAVKFLHPELARKRDLLTRFQREAEAAGGLESENVAAAVDLGVSTDGSPYIVMEHLVGESLEHLLGREGTLPASRATDLVQQACRGIQAAHLHGIVHRDLKPHNLFVCRREDGTDLVKVLDFGVAKLEVLEQNSAATRTGTVLGTPSYMSPEQARGEKGVGHAADVYALGAILYELLSGKKPHPGESHNAILHHISTQPAILLSTVTDGLPAELVAVVMKALAPAPEARPPSADALAQALVPWVERKSWPAPAPEQLTPVGAEASSTELAPPRPSEPFSPAPSPAVASLDRERTRSPNGPRLVALGGALALAAVVLALRQSAAPPPAESSAAPKPAATSTAEPAPADPTLVRQAAEPAAPPAAPEPAPSEPHPATHPASPASASAASTSLAPARSVVDSRPPASRPAHRPAAAEARVPPTEKKPSTPTEPAASPVTFDQKNPYH